MSYQRCDKHDNVYARNEQCVYCMDEENELEENRPFAHTPSLRTQTPKEREVIEKITAQVEAMRIKAKP